MASAFHLFSPSLRGQEEMEEALDHLSPEERAERRDQWAQERAERLRMENAQYLELRRPGERILGPGGEKGSVDFGEKTTCLS